MSEVRTDLSGSPLAESFERMAKIQEGLYLFARLGVPPEDDGWISMRGLLSDKDFLRECIGLYRKKWDLDNRTSAIGFVGNIVWQAGGAALLLYATERRVPDLSPRNIAFRLPEGGVEEAAFTTGRFAALAEDPASGNATATFEDEDGLREYLREGLEKLMEPVIDEVRAATKVGKRTMWNRTADLAAQRLFQIGEATGERAWCGREAERLVKAPESPLNGATRFFTIEHEGREEVFLVRGCCCHAYKNPAHGYCGNCPLLTREELERRAVEEMAS